MKISLGTKIVLVLVAFAIVLSGVSIAVSYRSIQGMNDEHYLGRADEIAATVSRVVDAKDLATLQKKTMEIYASTPDRVTSDEWGTPEFENYVGRYADLVQTPEYQRILAQLRNLQEVNDVDCLYTVFVVPQDEAFVYLVDAAEEEPCPIGCIDPIYEMNREVLVDPTVGFPACITDTEEYGWLVSAGVPVYDDGDEVVGYAFADISMDVIKQKERDYIQQLSIMLVVLTVAICALVIVLVRRFIVRPLKTLSKAATSYCTPQANMRSTFAGLDIHSKDEIGDLHKSMIQMENDIDTYIDNLVETRAKLNSTRREADLMSDLAHKDALTGVRNRLAYEQEIAQLDAELAAGQDAFGIAVVDLNDLKTTNDQYGHECGNVSLQRVSHFICLAFAHSPVFRIGGDEFVVVLRGNDFDKVEDLVAEFRETLASQDDAESALEPWERVSAAIGYALYDSDLDTDADSVFRRADKLMYENKKQMKGDAGVR